MCCRTDGRPQPLDSRPCDQKITAVRARFDTRPDGTRSLVIGRGLVAARRPRGLFGGDARGIGLYQRRLDGCVAPGFVRTLPICLCQ